MTRKLTITAMLLLFISTPVRLYFFRYQSVWNFYPWFLVLAVIMLILIAAVSFAKTPPGVKDQPLRAIIYIVIVATAVIAVARYAEISKPAAQEAPVTKVYTPIDIDYLNIPVNPPSDLNGKSKQDIAAARANFIKNGLFGKEEYELSDSVFGQIEKTKPWISIETMNCRNTMPLGTQGLSEESRFINNPSALIMINMAMLVVNTQDCPEDMWIMPKSIEYFKAKNTIKIHYNLSYFISKVPQENRRTALFTLDGLNARDLGYNWLKVNNTQNIQFSVNNSALGHPYPLRDFIHVGGSCRVNGGCNNSSPRQQEFEFAITQLPAEIDLNLYRKMTDDEHKDTADIKVHISIE